MIDLEQKIRERAYQIWELEGRIHGRHAEHWHMAKLELTSAAEASAAIEAPVSAEPAKKGRRAAAKPAAPAPAAAPRRRRATATLQ